MQWPARKLLLVDMWSPMQYRHDPLNTYEASKSNIVDAMGHSRKVIRRAHKQGSLPLLQQQVDKMLEKQCFRELDKEEITQLATSAHNFTYFNWVHNPTSVSTPFRMISNTSTVSNCTTISTEQLSPANVLNPQENSLIRFHCIQCHCAPISKVLIIRS